MDIKHRYAAAQDALRRARRILIVSHKKPDGDTLGAAAGLLLACHSWGFPADAFCLDPVPPPYRYMPGTEQFSTDPALFAAADTIAVCDAGDLAYAGIERFVLDRTVKPVIINFDHHATNRHFGDINVVDAGASSTAEVVYHFLEFCRAEVSQKVATSLLTGILTDTSVFSNPATTSASLDAASALMRRGAKIQDVSNRLMRNKPIEALKLWGEVLSRLKYDAHLGIASTVIFERDLRESGVEDEHVEGLSNFLNHVLSAKVVMVLRELPGGKVKGSLRTAEEIDVSALAKLLGGGGHKKAAGFTVSGKIVEANGAWRVV